MYYEVGSGPRLPIFPHVYSLERECNVNFLTEGDLSGPSRRSLRELHTLPHRNGYRSQNELDSKVRYRAELTRIILANSDYTEIITSADFFQCDPDAMYVQRCKRCRTTGYQRRRCSQVRTVGLVNTLTATFSNLLFQILIHAFSLSCIYSFQIIFIYLYIYQKIISLFDTIHLI